MQGFTGVLRLDSSLRRQRAGEVSMEVTPSHLLLEKCRQRLAMGRLFVQGFVGQIKEDEGAGHVLKGSCCSLPSLTTVLMRKSSPQGQRAQ